MVFAYKSQNVYKGIRVITTSGGNNLWSCSSRERLRGHHNLFRSLL